MFSICISYEQEFVFLLKGALMVIELKAETQMWDLGLQEKAKREMEKDSESVWVLRNWNSCEQTVSQVT